MNQPSTYAWQVHHSERWTKLSILVRREQPICCNPYGQHGSFLMPTKQVHHIVAIETNPELAFEKSNLCALCETCHAHLTTLELRKVDTVLQVRAAMDELRKGYGLSESVPVPCALLYGGQYLCQRMNKVVSTRCGACPSHVQPKTPQLR